MSERETCLNFFTSSYSHTQFYYVGSWKVEKRMVNKNCIESPTFLLVCWSPLFLTLSLSMIWSKTTFLFFIPREWTSHKLLYSSFFIHTIKSSYKKLSLCDNDHIRDAKNYYHFLCLWTWNFFLRIMLTTLKILHEITWNYWLKRLDIIKGLIGNKN